MDLRLLIPALALAIAGAAPAPAAEKTVCTITVNSADEKEALRARLPKGKYRFVELVEKGRRDWLRSACTRGERCDVLVVSGHFNAGDTFYSDRLERDEFLDIDALERAACSGSCPGLFGGLREVYLFGCESLDPRPSANGSGEGSRERMRRIFARVPAIYGFPGTAPVGPDAASILARFLDGGAAGFGSGRHDARLLRMFSAQGMTRTSGTKEGEALFAERQRICRFFDARETTASRLRFVHRLLREGGFEPHLHRVEKLLATAGDALQDAAAFQALAEISADDTARERFLAATRQARDAGLRARRIALAERFGWLSSAQYREEVAALLGDVLAQPAPTFAEVDLACRLNATGALDSLGDRLAARAGKGAGHSAVLACLGHADSRQAVLAALASAEPRNALVAQAYLRHRPLSDPAALRDIVRRVVRLEPAAAQVRALGTLARLRIADRQALEALARAYAAARTPAVQAAIAEVFLRADPAALPREGLADVLRRHRVKDAGDRQDLVDALLARLESGRSSG